jgi:hypothetical protein
MLASVTAIENGHNTTRGMTHIFDLSSKFLFRIDKAIDRCFQAALKFVERFQTPQAKFKLERQVAIFGPLFFGARIASLE